MRREKGIGGRMTSRPRPGEPEWSLKARRLNGDFALDLTNYSPTDFAVESAKNNRLDFWSPIGLHLWNKEQEGYSIMMWLDD